MSQFTVCRSWNGYCLLLDDERIAGGKPDYHEGNVLYEWRTRDTYGPVDNLQAENAKLRELAKEACELAQVFYYCGGTFNDLDDLLCEASELGIEVDA